MKKTNMPILSDFVLLDAVQEMTESRNQYFEIIMHGSEVEDIPATASAQMRTSNANAFSANHCQPGKAAKIFKIKLIRGRIKTKKNKKKNKKKRKKKEKKRKRKIEKYILF